MFRRTFFAAVLVTLVLCGSLAAEEARELQPGSFRTLDIWVDSNGESLAAYQIEIVYDRSKMKVVGIEGGESKAFNAAPYYDPAGMSGGRIVIAAFTAKDEDAPRGRTRVARLHLHVTGPGAPGVEIRLVTAARPGGARIEPKVELAETEEGDKR